MNGLGRGGVLIEVKKDLDHLVDMLRIRPLFLNLGHGGIECFDLVLEVLIEFDVQLVRVKSLKSKLGSYVFLD